MAVPCQPRSTANNRFSFGPARPCLFKVWMRTTPVPPPTYLLRSSPTPLTSGGRSLGGPLPSLNSSEGLLVIQWEGGRERQAGRPTDEKWEGGKEKAEPSKRTPWRRAAGAARHKTAGACHLTKHLSPLCHPSTLQSHLCGPFSPLTGREAGSVRGVPIFFGTYLVPFPQKEPGHTLRQHVPLLALSTRVYVSSFHAPKAMVSSPLKTAQRTYLCMCLTLKENMSQ